MMNPRLASAMLASSLVASLIVSMPVATISAPRAGLPVLGVPAVGVAARAYSPFLASAPTRLAMSPAERGLAANVAVLRNGRDLGRAPAGTPIHIAVLLKAQHQTELEDLVSAQGNRNSPYYRHFLSSAQFVRYFAPTAASVARVEARLRVAGFRIEHVTANRTMVAAVAPAAYAGRYFRTSFDLTRQQGREITYGNRTPAIVPAELKADIISVAGLHSFRTMHFDVEHETPQSRAARRAWQSAHYVRPLSASISAHAVAPRAVAIATPSGDPRLITLATAAPGPNPTELVETPTSDFTLIAGQGYGAPIFNTAYDFPTQHGYNGSGHAAGSVIDTDYSDNDLAKLTTQYAITPHHAGVNEFRVCYDGTPAGTTPSASCQLCVPAMTTNGTNCDTDGESGLDAETIMTMAPGAAFYEFLAPSFGDAQIEEAYETAVSQDIVDAVNSSFGGCETDDPGFEYSANYIALEGAAEGITFSASAGDTGGESCGLYATNGVPQTFTNTSTPADAAYFVGVGGTSFDTLATCTTTSCYTSEQAWLEGGGGSSVLEPQPTWQNAATSAVGATASMVSTTARDVPDIAFTADGGAEFIGGTQGNGLIICSSAISAATPCDFTGSGGTSLASPIYVALQTEINQVTGNRNGFVNPRLYAVEVANSGFAFRDIIVGNNERFNAGVGYDEATGLGTPLGFELASSE